MNPNKFLTASSPLQIPTHASQHSVPSDASLNGSAQLLARDTAKQAGDSPSAPRESPLESADFSTENLSDQQVAVLRAIAKGRSIVAAAREAGVGRTTVYRWHQDPHFQKCLQAWQSQSKESGRNIMLTLIERSARIVERALDKDDLRVALTLLTKLGVLADKELPAMNPVEGSSRSSVKELAHRPSAESSASAVETGTPATRGLPNSNPRASKSFMG